MPSLLDSTAKLALLLVGTTIGIGAAEMLVRVTNGTRYAERPTFYPADGDLGWSPAPGLDHVYYGGDYSITVATDSEGHRLGRLGDVPDDAERVILLGDSYTFGWGVSTNDTYASQLDELLASGSETTVMRAVNLGVGGYGTVQSSMRLERYLGNHPAAPLAAIVLLHSHNDPSDNVTFATVQAGLREFIESPRNRGLHLHNLLRLLGSAVGAESGTTPNTLPGGHRDFLWTVGASLTAKGRSVMENTENDEPPVGSDDELLWPGQEVLPTYERETLTRLQLELLRTSIERISEIGIQRDVPVLHATIHSAPDWYVEPIRELVQRTAAGDPRVTWCGRLPADEEYAGPVSNEHSGSHFTPQLNRYYAQKIATWVGQGGCR